MPEDFRGPSVKPPSALDALRRATAESHRRLEAMPVQARLLEDDYALAEYQRLLERLYGFYEPLVPALGAHAYAVPWGARVAARTELLRLDLVAIGLTPAALADFSRCADLPALDSIDRVLGCAYVLEGSSLGGRVIYKHLARVFGTRSDLPLRFFAGDGDQTGPLWRQFCATVNAAATNADELCAAASATFDALGKWLAEPLLVSS